jgi:hypothetical protein
MIEIGQEKQFNNITFRIVEVVHYVSGTGQREILVGYRIKVGDWESPTGHFWMPVYADINKKIIETIIHNTKASAELRSRIDNETLNKLQKMLEEEEEKKSIKVEKR